MDKLLQRIFACIAEGKISKEQGHTLEQFFISYSCAVQENGKGQQKFLALLGTLLDLVCETIAQPFTFGPYHKAIRHPFDYYRFGLDFIRPLVAFDKSTLKKRENIPLIEKQLQEGENVILFANHQTEPDPQIISLLLEKEHSKLAENMIFVAGHRVVTDPLAIPFSKGRNLLCIFSKKYIANPPEEKEAKLLHNKLTMKKMGSLLSEGGKCIYVAPSGGRDRKDAQGNIEVAPFDPQSIELFKLIAKSAGPKPHFYPLALYTYDVLPPPNSMHCHLSEERRAQISPVHVSFGSEIDMDSYSLACEGDRQQRRKARADYIWGLVKSDYELLKV